MTNKFYSPGQQRAAKVNDLFNTIASRYDLLNDLQSFGLHRLWKRRLVHLAASQPGERVLDLCCGTGDIALAFARLGLEVTGLDFSEQMLTIARHRAESHGRVSGGPAIQFLHGDAQQIPFPDASFDIVSVGYGLRNLADWESGLREMKRVAKPGGRLLVLDFGKPPNRVLRTFYFVYLKYCVPILGWLFCGDADTHGYILKSLIDYAAQCGVAAQMRSLGLEDVRIINLVGGAMSINFGRKPK